MFRILKIPHEDAERNLSNPFESNSTSQVFQVKEMFAVVTACKMIAMLSILNTRGITLTGTFLNDYLG